MGRHPAGTTSTSGSTQNQMFPVYSTVHTTSLFQLLFFSSSFSRLLFLDCFLFCFLFCSCCWCIFICDCVCSFASFLWFLALFSLENKGKKRRKNGRQTTLLVLSHMRKKKNASLYDNTRRAAPCMHQPPPPPSRSWHHKKRRLARRKPAYISPRSGSLEMLKPIANEYAMIRHPPPPPPPTYLKKKLHRIHGTTPAALLRLRNHAHDAAILGAVLGRPNPGPNRQGQPSRRRCRPIAPRPPGPLPPSASTAPPGVGGEGGHARGGHVLARCQGAADARGGRAPSCHQRHHAGHLFWSRKKCFLFWRGGVNYSRTE